MKAVKLSKKYQIAIPKSIRNKMGLSAGDILIIDVSKDKINLIPKPRNYTEHTKSLHSEIWKNINIDEYIRDERKSWDKKGNKY